MFKTLFKPKTKKTILLIEDNEDLAGTIEIALTARGYPFLRARGGQEGLNLALRDKPGLVILDIGLPDIDGWWVLQNLKDLKETKDIPVIIFTQLNQMGDINAGFNLGARDYLVKPIDLEQLLNKLQEILE